MKNNIFIDEEQLEGQVNQRLEKELRRVLRDCNIELSEVALDAQFARSASRSSNADFAGGVAEFSHTAFIAQMMVYLEDDYDHDWLHAAIVDNHGLPPHPFISCGAIKAMASKFLDKLTFMGDVEGTKWLLRQEFCEKFEVHEVVNSLARSMVENFRNSKDETEEKIEEFLSIIFEEIKDKEMFDTTRMVMEQFSKTDIYQAFGIGIANVMLAVAYGEIDDTCIMRLNQEADLGLETMPFVNQADAINAIRKHFENQIGEQEHDFDLDI